MMLRPAGIATLTALLAAACGEAAPGLAVRTDGRGGSATPMIACPSGAKLPITGLCNTAEPYLFVMVDDTVDMLASRCVWRTEEVRLSDKEALVFRAQDCTREGWVRTVYSHVSGYLKHRMDGTPEDQAEFALQIIPLGPGETAKQAAVKTLAQAPEDQRGRCQIERIDQPKVSGEAFILAPVLELREELQLWSDNVEFDACGPNGLSMSVQQFWEGRKDVALFHIFGRDMPQWDPASFTLYRLGDEGRWSKVS